MVRIKRAYAAPARGDGHRVLVDRLWPRGVRKDGARLDEWVKAVAPSDELREWFAHEPERFDEFRRRYQRELRAADATAAVTDLARLSAAETVTLVYAARDEEHNNAVVLADEIRRRQRRGRAVRPSARGATRRRTRPQP